MSPTTTSTRSEELLERGDTHVDIESAITATVELGSSFETSLTIESEYPERY